MILVFSRIKKAAYAAPIAQQVAALPLPLFRTDSEQHIRNEKYTRHDFAVNKGSLWRCGMRHILDAWNPPPPANANKASRIFLALILSIFLIGLASALVSFNDIRDKEAFVAQAANSQEAWDKLSREEKVERECKDFKQESARAGQEISSRRQGAIKQGKTFQDLCVSVVRKPDPSLNPHDPETYECKGLNARVEQIYRRNPKDPTDVIDYLSVYMDRNLKNEKGTCTVLVCKSEAECVATRLRGVSTEVVDLLDPKNNTRKELERDGELRSLKLQPGEYTYGHTYDAAWGFDMAARMSCARGSAQCEEMKELAEEKMERARQVDPFEDFLKGLENRQQMSSIELPTQAASLNENLKNSSRLAPSVLSSNYPAYGTPNSGIQNIAQSTFIPLAPVPPNFGPVAPHQWQQVVFVSNLRTQIF